MLQDFSSVSDHFMTLGQFISGQFSLQMCSCLGKGVLKLCSKFSGEYRCLKVIYNFIEITFWNGCSPANFCIEMEEDLWKRPFELRAETSTQEEILTIRSRNCRSSCSQIFVKISVLKNFAIFTGKHLCWSPLLRKLQVLNTTILLKGDSNTGVFLWILQNF